jgi:cyclopropane-fatty-acyl-phospholipid synthase
VSSTGNTIATQAPRRPLLARVAFPIVERVFRGLEGGALEARLPDGSVRRFGSGSTVQLDVLDDRLFSRVATHGSIGLGEAYQEGWWRSDDLVRFLELLLENAALGRERHPRLSRFLQARPRSNRRQGLLAARRNIAAHYDLGNELFELMLDATMTYSCAIFESLDESLEEAQLRKLRRVCERLELQPGDRVLEIGCGWGSFALVAASEFGAQVTGLTLSAEQAALARERVAQAGLDGRIAILEEDYRVHQGSYDRIASIEMIEAIGEKQFPVFFGAVDRLLVPGGRACVQTILIPDERWPRYRKTPDWIERHVFPGCLIPSLAALTHAMARGSRLTVAHVEEIGTNYAETLRRWRERFLAAHAEVRALGYDERFVRTWDFYLAVCEAGFRTRWLRDAQVVLTR